MKILNCPGWLSNERHPGCTYCLRLFPVFLLIFISLSVGCAKRAPVQQPPEPAPVTSKYDDVIEAARSNLGTPYKYGGTTPKTGFDCSGLVCWSYEQVGITLPRRARDQLNFGTKVPKTELQPGDIVVFKGTGRSGWHSGIYTGDGMFVHSPRTGKTVTETPLSNTYFAKRFKGASRVPVDGSDKVLFAEYQKKTAAAAQAKPKKTLAKKTNKKNQTQTTAAVKPKRKTPASAPAKQTAKKQTVADAKKKTLSSSATPSKNPKNAQVRTTSSKSKPKNQPDA